MKDFKLSLKFSNSPREGEPANARFQVVLGVMASKRTIEVADKEPVGVKQLDVPVSARLVGGGEHAHWTFINELSLLEAALMRGVTVGDKLGRSLAVDEGFAH